MGAKKFFRDADKLLKNIETRTVNVEKKQYLFQKKTDEGMGAFVLEGMVYLCVENENFERIILQYFGPGDAFFHSMLTQVGYGMSYLITKKPAKLALFSKSQLTESVLAELSERNLLSHNYILHHKTIRTKLMAYFQRESYFQESNNLEMPLPFSDLADYLAIDRTSMMKEISNMKNEGLISGKNHKIIIHFS